MEHGSGTCRSRLLEFSYWICLVSSGRIFLARKNTWPIKVESILTSRAASAAQTIEVCSGQTGKCPPFSCFDSPRVTWIEQVHSFFSIAVRSNDTPPSLGLRSPIGSICVVLRIALKVIAGPRAFDFFGTTTAQAQSFQSEGSSSHTLH